MTTSLQNEHNVARRVPSRRVLVHRGTSLLELMAVVSIVGLLSLAAITRFGHSTIQNTGAEVFARTLSLDLLQARRRTIATGDNHYLQMTTSGGNVLSYVLMRRTNTKSGDIAVDEVKTVPNEVFLKTSHTTLEFDFEGAALAGYEVGVIGPDRSWSISVITATGMVDVTETT